MTGRPETEDADRRPRWQKKRWRAAGLLWLAVWYPLSAWPVEYLYGRGWIARGGLAEGAAGVVYLPLRQALGRPASVRPTFRWYIAVNVYLMELGRRHAAP